MAMGSASIVSPVSIPTEVLLPPLNIDLIGEVVLKKHGIILHFLTSIWDYPTIS